MTGAAEDLAACARGAGRGDPAAFALGSNLGDRAACLAAARERIAAAWGPLRACSAVYETQPVGPPGQGAYLNQVVVVAHAGGPEDLLAGALAIEAALGRRRGERWGPRTIDIDLLLHGERVRTGPALVLPHPRLHERAFVLAPLAEVLPRWRHPLLGADVEQLLARVGRAGVERWPGAAAAARGPLGERRGRDGE